MVRLAAVLLLLIGTAASAGGPKRTQVTPTPIPCPRIAPTRVDVTPLQAPDLVLGFEAFLRVDFEVPEALAVLGAQARCGRSVSTFTTFELAPRDPRLAAATLELYDDRLIAVELDLAKPIPVDLAKLAKQHGPAHTIRGLHRASEGVWFALATPTYRGRLLLAIDDTGLRHISYRRTPLVEILPDRFTTVDDLARLVKLVVQAPEPVKLYGTLGVFDRARSTADRDALLPSLHRNIAGATIEHVQLGRRRAVKSVALTLAKPIPGDLATALGAKPGTPIAIAGGAVTFDGTRLVIERR